MFWWRRIVFEVFVSHEEIMDNKMKIIIYSLFLLLASCISAEVNTEKQRNIEKLEEEFKSFHQSCLNGEILIVSIIKLTIIPNDYNGRCVSVTGFIRIEHESDRIYSSIKSYKDFNYLESISIDIPWEKRDHYKDLNGFETTLVGVVRVENSEKNGVYHEARLESALYHPYY